MARDYNKELNFQDAVANAYLAYTERDLNSESTTVPMSNFVDDKTTKLGLLQSALETFMKEHPDQRSPLNGSVSDMTESTDLYVRLQRLYRDQPEEDVKKITDIIRRQQQDNAEKVVTEDDISNCFPMSTLLGMFMYLLQWLLIDSYEECEQTFMGSRVEIKLGILTFLVLS